MPPIVFFGTSEFAIPAFETLVKAGYKISSVITQPDKPAERGLALRSSPVKVKALELGLRVFEPPTLKQLEAESLLRECGAEVAIVAAYGKIIPQNILDIFPRGVLNIHPSLLPKYRGPSPIQSAILNGDEETGITIMLLDAEMDHGSILMQKGLRIKDYELRSGLEERLSELGANLLIEVLPQWMEGKIKPREQDHAAATVCKMVEKEDGKIDWNKSAVAIERMVRAYEGWPGTWALWDGKRLKILKALVLHESIGCANNSTPGFVWKTEQGELAVNCLPGSLVLEQVQMEGKKPATGEEFLRGHLRILGVVLGQ
ncbi:MAG: methionyl-tRNA formyltransferase [Patescibacteria group bacterium]